MRRAPYALIAVAVAAVGLLALRDTDAFLRPDFWAEDGRAFFRGWNMFGWSSFIEPYAGYLHLMPRIVAAAAGLLPLEWTLVVFLVGAAAFSAWASVTLFLCLPGPAAWLGALTPLLAFGGSEVLGTPTNLQWITAIALAAIAVSAPGGTANKAAMVVIAGLSGPFSLIYLPVFATRLWLLRTHRPEVIVCALALLCGAIQGGFILSQPQAGGGTLGLATLGTAGDLVKASVGSSWGLVALAAATAGLAAGTYRLPRVGLAVLAGLVLAGIAVKFAPMPDMFAGGDVGHRYWYVPSGLLLLSLALMLAEPGRWLRRAGAVGTVAFLLGYAYQPFLVPEPIHYGSWEQGIRDGVYRYPPDKTVPVPRR